MTTDTCTTSAPIFLFSSSWRSGSTLVQRYITATGEALVWGETGGALDAVRDALVGWETITAPASARFGETRGGDGEAAYRRFRDSPKEGRPHIWIANLNPPLSEIHEATRDYLERLYGAQAHAFGYPRFGVKETRCDLSTAQALRRLFPDARFVFLVRNPLDVMTSLKRREWLGAPPGIRTLRRFARHWLERSSQFRTADFGFAMRYEDFVADDALRRRMLDYLGIQRAAPTDFVHNSRVDWKSDSTCRLSPWEQILLRRWLAREMREWGYGLL